MIVPIEPYITSCPTFQSMTNQYLAALRSGGPDARNMAIVLSEYLHPESKRLVRFVEQQKKQIFNIIDAIIPARITVYGRKKSFYSYDTKLRETKNVRDVKDVYAFRLIIDDIEVGKEQAIAFCYMAAKALIDFYQTEKSYTVSELSVCGVTGTLNTKEKIFIPNEQLIPDYIFLQGYNYYFKDYILNPKPNGYQSLHVRVEKDGIAVEIQVRTSSMEDYNEHGGAKHDGVYKTLAPKELVTKVHMDGIRYDTLGRITEDQHGLFVALPIGEKLITAA